METDKEILQTLASYINKECSNYAISQMTDNDFILLRDANYIKTLDIIKFNNNKEFTLKKSSASSFDGVYYAKLSEILKNLVK